MEIARQIIGNVEEVFVDGRMIFYPLMGDSSTIKESVEPGSVRENNGRFYVGGIEIDTLIENFRNLYEENYAALKQDFTRRILPGFKPEDLIYGDFSQALRATLFEVMPSYISRKGLERKRLDDQQVLSYIRDHFEIPTRFYEEAKKISTLNKLEESLSRLEKMNISDVSFGSGLKRVENLESAMIQHLEGLILQEEKVKIASELDSRKQQFLNRETDIATLLFLQDKGEFEVDGFGMSQDYKFTRGAGHGVYKKIGEYALRDFDGKVYLFPPCTVSVGINSECKMMVPPIIVEEYAHPFLKHKAIGREICIKRGWDSSGSQGKTLANALEAGVNTMLYGYFNREGFNGYHRLNHSSEDPISLHFGRIYEDDERIKSGKVKITNDPFIQMSGGW